MTTFRITPKGQFSLEASTRFLEGFAPAAFDGAQAPGHLHLAFSVEGSWEDTVGVCVRKTDKFVIGEIFGDAPRDAVRQQIARILSLNVDGSEFQAVGERDLVVGRLQRSYPGLRPVLFWSPYEPQPGRSSVIASAFCRPRASSSACPRDWVRKSTFTDSDYIASLLHSDSASIDGFPGLFERKIEQLHVVARAALEGQLNATQLRSRPRAEALAELKHLPASATFRRTDSRARRRRPRPLLSQGATFEPGDADAYGFEAIPSVERLASIERMAPLPILGERALPYRARGSNLRDIRRQGMRRPLAA